MLGKEHTQSRTSQEKMLTDLLNSLKDGPSEINTLILAPEYENNAIGTLDMDK